MIPDDLPPDLNDGVHAPCFAAYRTGDGKRLSLDFGEADCPPGLAEAFAQIDSWNASCEEPSTSADLALDVEKHLMLVQALQQEAYANGDDMAAFVAPDLSDA